MVRAFWTTRNSPVDVGPQPAEDIFLPEKLDITEEKAKTLNNHCKYHREGWVAGEEGAASWASMLRDTARQHDGFEGKRHPSS